MNTIGDRVKQLRKELKITQADLGQLIGISGPGVARIEAGKSKPTEAALKLICATYHVNYMWLTEGVGDMMQDESIDDMVDRIMVNDSPLAREIMKMFARLPAEEWERLRDVIDAVQKNGPLV